MEEEEDDEVEEDDVEEEDVEEEDRSLGWQTHFVRAALWKFTGKMGEDISGETSGDSASRESAQLKCTWTFHKSHSV